MTDPIKRIAELERICGEVNEFGYATNAALIAQCTAMSACLRALREILATCLSVEDKHVPMFGSVPELDTESIRVVIARALEETK